jgi:biotin carboxylase
MSCSSEQTIAVVDPVAAGGPYGLAARELGLSPIAVFTRDFTTAYVLNSYQPERYAAQYRHRTLADTLAYLAERGLRAIVAGAQTGLKLSDLVADSLGLVGNPVQSASARTSKRAMKERWARLGVPCAAWHESSDVASILKWAEREGYPVVLKPDSSSGSEHVYLCNDPAEVRRAFDAITRQPDMFDRRFRTVLAEEYLDGDEYFIDLLHDGTGPAEIISVARYDKYQGNGAAGICRGFRSLPLDHSVAQQALPYVRAASEALEVRYGINDAEFKLTSRGLRLVEVNNRLPGANTVQMIENCSGLNCLQANIEIFLGRYVRPASGYQFTRHYSVCCLINDHAGEVTGYQGLAEISELPSYHSSRLAAEVGRYWPITRNLSTAWGMVWLVHDDPAQLGKDSAAVHEAARLLTT